MVAKDTVPGVEAESVDDDALSDLFNDDFYSSDPKKEKAEKVTEEKEEFNPYKDLDDETPTKTEKAEPEGISREDLNSLRSAQDSKIDKLTEGLTRLESAITTLVTHRTTEPGTKEIQVSDAVKKAQETIDKLSAANPENAQNMKALQDWLDAQVAIASNGKNSSLADLIKTQGGSEAVSKQVSELSNKLETKEIKEAFDALGDDPNFNIPGEYYSGKVFRDTHLFPLIAEEKRTGVKDGISATIYKRMKSGESPKEVMDYLYSKALTNYRREAAKNPNFLNEDPVLKQALIAEKKRMHSNPGGTSDPYKRDFTGSEDGNGKKASDEDRILDFMGDMAFKRL